MAKETKDSSLLSAPEVQTALGSAFAKELTDAEAYPALVIGKDRWSKDQLAREVGVVNTKAASILTRICKLLGVRSVQDLYEKSSPYTFADVQLRAGVTTMYVMFSVFRAEGLDIRRWYHKGTDEKAALVSFLHLKHREQAAEARTKKAARRTRAS